MIARPELTGLKPDPSRDAMLPMQVRAAGGRVAFSIREFCSRHGISRAHFYNIRKLGLGPLEMDVGGRKLISIEAEHDWRRARECRIEGDHLSGAKDFSLR